MKLKNLIKKEKLNSDPIFIHSLFRTGSTYLWNKIIENPKNFCYYEPLHQNLCYPTKMNDIIWSFDSESTNAIHHPKLFRSHSLEYQELINQDLPGIEYFDKSFSFDDFCVVSNHPNFKNYIDNLVLKSKCKIPIFQFNRTSFRMEWFKKNYKNSHNIYLVRNPEQQWTSYERLNLENKLDVFSVMDLLIISKNIKRPCFEILSKYLYFICFDSPLFIEEESMYRELLNCYSIEERFALFYFLWLSSFFKGLLFANSFIDINMLSLSKNYQNEISELFSKLGIENISFSDANVVNYNTFVIHENVLNEIKSDIEFLVLQNFTEIQIEIMKKRYEKVKFACCNDKYKIFSVNKKKISGTWIKNNEIRVKKINNILISRFNLEKEKSKILLGTSTDVNLKKIVNNIDTELNEYNSKKNLICNLIEKEELRKQKLVENISNSEVMLKDLNVLINEKNDEIYLLNNKIKLSKETYIKAENKLKGINENLMSTELEIKNRESILSIKEEKETTLKLKIEKLKNEYNEFQNQSLQLERRISEKNLYLTDKLKNQKLLENEIIDLDALIYRKRIQLNILNKDLKKNIDINSDLNSNYFYENIEQIINKNISEWKIEEKDLKDRIFNLRVQLDRLIKRLSTMHTKIVSRKQDIEKLTLHIKKLRDSFEYRLGKRLVIPILMIKKLFSIKRNERKMICKNKLAFIDHSFHKYSTATFFLMEILRQHFDVEVFWDESWKQKNRVDLGKIVKLGFNTIILFQQIHYSEIELNSLKGKNVILIPMFDASGGLEDSFWKKFENFKIINFSKTLHKKHKRLNLNSKYYQYFPDPNIFKRFLHNNSMKGFFWQRTDKITWDLIRNLIKGADFSKIHIHAAIDPPGYDFIEPTMKEKEDYNITISKWFDKREEYFDIVNNSNIYFAPRLYEGIGMSFLEAMAQGMCVVAPNYPTMNEYIVNNVNGLLYDPEKVEPLDFSNLGKICYESRNSIKRGYLEWRSKIEELVDFINDTSNNQTKKITFMDKFLRFIYKLFKIEKIKNVLFIFKLYLKDHFPKLFNILKKMKNL